MMVSGTVICAAVYCYTLDKLSVFNSQGSLSITESRTALKRSYFARLTPDGMDVPYFCRYLKLLRAIVIKKWKFCLNLLNNFPMLFIVSYKGSSCIYTFCQSQWTQSSEMPSEGLVNLIIQLKTFILRFGKRTKLTTMADPKDSTNSNESNFCV